MNHPPSPTDSQRSRTLRTLPYLWGGVLVLLLLACLLTDRLPQPGGEVELLFPRQSEALSWLRYERKTFEDAFTDVIGLTIPEGGSTDAPFDLESLEESLVALPGITSVVVPTLDASEDIFGLVSDDGRHLRIIVKISSRLRESERETLSEALKELLGRYTQYTPRQTGTFTVAMEVASTVADETTRVIPWIGTVLILIVLLFLRDLSSVVFVLGATLASLMNTLLCYSLLGYPLGPVSQLAPPFLLAVGTTFHLHTTARLAHTPPQDHPRIRSELRWSIALAGATTATSLFTLILLDVGDVTRFAWLAGCGTLLQAFSACLFPLMFSKSPSGETSIKSIPFVHRILLPLLRWEVVSGVILATTFLAFGISHLEVHTDPLRFLPEENEIRQDVMTMRKEFSGNHYLSLLMQVDSSTSGETLLNSLSEVQETLNLLPEIDRVITPLDFREATSEGLLGDIFADLSLRSSRIPTEFASEDLQNLRILIETHVEGRDLLHLHKILEAQLSSLFFEKDVAYGITSFELIMAEQTDHIVRGLLQSLAISILIVFGLLLILFRSLSIALVGLVPNVLPLVGVFGALGFTVQDLDFGACLVASSALGIAVDNTFHFLFCWKAHRNAMNDPVLATRETILRTSAPFLITSISLIVGFSTMLLARSAPVAHFGILLGITLVIGLIADLVVLPYILVFRHLLRPPYRSNKTPFATGTL
jgi:predicted RND superfamily exporter protein